MERWSAKEGFGCLVIIFFMIWILVQCTGGGGEKSDPVNTYTETMTYLAADIETYNRGQEILATGDALLFSSYLNSNNVKKIEAGTDVYVHDASIKGYVKVTITSGLYKGEVGYMPGKVLK